MNKVNFESELARLEEDLVKGFTQQGNRIKYQRLVKESGHSIRISVYGKTCAECLQKFEQKRGAWVQSIKLSVDYQNGHVPLYEGMIKYFTEHDKINGKRKAIKRSTNSRDLSTVNNQIRDYPIARKLADQITASDLQQHIDLLLSKGYAESTVQKVKNCLRAYFYYIYRSPVNPAYQVTLPHITDYAKSCHLAIEWSEILDDLEIVAFLNQCDEAYIPNHRSTRYADLLKFLFYTYMRVGEACALKVKSYYKRNGIGYISITQTVSRAGNEFYMDTPKQAKSIRTLRLTKEAQAIIENRIIGKQPDDFIWSQKNGDFVKYTTLSMPFKHMLLNAGIEKDLSLHNLRHSGISFSLRHGAAIAAVSRNAGHASITITQEIYQHVLQDERDTAVEIAESALTQLKLKLKSA